MNNEELATRAQEVSAVLKQLAHPDRLKVLCSLSEGEKTVSDLVDYTGASQSWLSQCLSRMRLDRLVETRKEGTFVYYKISDRKLKNLMQSIYKVYCSQP